MIKSVKTPKDKLFQTAALLFYQRGYRAVGVDTIAAEAGIAKMTLYRHYPSKDDLIVAFLRASDDEFWEYFEHSIAAAGAPREKLIAFFEALQSYVTSPECCGCPFINVAIEYPDPQYAGHRIAVEHKLRVVQRFSRLAAEAGARRPEDLAHSLLLLMDGAYMAARMYGADPLTPAAEVARSARRLIDAQTSGAAAEQI